MIRPALLSLQRLLVLATAGCALLPAGVDRIPTSALKDTEQTRISRTVLPLTSAHPQESGAYALFSARDAFAARWTLASNAERSLDVQYYIWRPDTSGSLMAHALREAAERGVRVRVLLDDANTSGLDEDIAAIASHPNIQVRLFNPFANRSWRAGDFVADFGRVNRRMHNKSFTADNRVTVVGGRNIGDEYLGAESRVAFSDLDLMVIGPVVGEVSAAFDAYWNSASAYPVGSLLPAPSAVALAEIEEKWARRRNAPMAADYLEAARKLGLVQRMRSGTLPLAWGPAHVLSDDPAKVLGTSGRGDVGIQGDLRAAFGMPQRELLLVSPYFVPGQGGSAMLAELAARGIRVSVLTNSLAATDVPATYAGYRRYRDLLLRAGVHVYELKPSVRTTVVADGGEDPRRGIPGSSGGSSTASLHAKTFVVDRQRVFVGSYNLDPRSARLNTEMGVVMDSPELAGQFHKSASWFSSPVSRLRGDRSRFFLRWFLGVAPRGAALRGETSIERSTMTTTQTGTVKWFNDSKGYGFISPDDGGKDLFAHFREIQGGDGFKTLAETARVQFEVAQGPKGPQASSIRAIN